MQLASRDQQIDGSRNLDLEAFELRARLWKFSNPHLQVGGYRQLS